MFLSVWMVKREHHIIAESGFEGIEAMLSFLLGAVDEYSKTVTHVHI